MNVLVGCEFSGIVREAFRKRGHNAVSCDLLPTEIPGSHIQGDVFRALCSRSWDLFIHHYSCTTLTNAGVRWLYGGKGSVRNPDRWKRMEEDAHTFRQLTDANVPRVCGENPIPHGYAREIMGDYSQIVHPHWFGHGETKATCLWLRNLPLLTPTDKVEGREPRVHHASPGPDRWKERSRTLQGFADAMADQWGNL